MFNTLRLSAVRLAAAAFIGFVATHAIPAQAATLGITSLAALGANDTIFWNQLGLNGNFVSGPQNLFLNGALAGTVNSPGGALRVLQQGKTWAGNFATGTAVLENYFVGGRTIAISFAQPVRGAGAQIQSNAPGNFTAKITAFGAGGATLGSFIEDGVSTSAGDGSAIFLGLLDSTADIYGIQFALTQPTFPSFDFAIGPLQINNSPIATTPLPATLPLFASALFAGWLVTEWRASSGRRSR